MKRQMREYSIRKLDSIRLLPNKGEVGFLNEKGIALVLVMILAMVSLAFVGAMLFMVTQGTMLSGAYKVYKSAEDASFGGTEVIQDYMLGKGNLSLPLLGINTGGSCTCDTNNDGDATINDNTDNATSARSCRCDKICNAHFNSSGLDNWTPPRGICNANDSSFDPTTNSDLQLTLGGGYDVFGKIVDTVAGNTDMGGLVTGGGSLGGGGVVSSNTGLVNPPQSPYLYRIEAQAQNTTNTAEQSRLSILYAY